MIPVFARIIARYVSAALVTYGLIDAEAGSALAMDQDLAILIGAGLAAITEGVYALAHRCGWRR